MSTDRFDKAQDKISNGKLDFLYEFEQKGIYD
jgi:hypothetical protein